MSFLEGFNFENHKDQYIFQPKCDDIIVVGLGYKFPTYKELRVPILQAEKNDINTRLEELKKSWESTRCMVISDGSIDGNGRTLLNFLH